MVSVGTIAISMLANIVFHSKVNPSVTTIPMNDDSIDHLRTWKFDEGYNYGRGINNHSNFPGIVRLDSKTKFSVSRDNGFTLEQIGNYLQLQTVRKNREITTTQKSPQTLQDFELKFSFTGNCVFPDNNYNEQCTYFPTFSTRDSINPETFLPSRITVSKNFDEFLTLESLEEIEQPGFQKGVNGQDIAFNFYIPCGGAVKGNSQTDRSTVDKEENIDRNLVFGLSTVRQIVQANNEKAVIKRTETSTNSIADDDNFLLNSAVKLGSKLIPDIEP